MKKIILLLLLFPSFLRAQKYPAFPKRVALALQQANKPLQDRTDYEYFNQPFVANFHPIGWSKDGKAAFLEWSEGEGSCYMRVIIYDAIKDTVAGSWSEDFGDENKMTIEQIQALWPRDKDSILPLLLKFQIVADTHQLYMDFPFDYTSGKTKKEFTMEYMHHSLQGDNHFSDSLFLMCGVRQNNKTDSLRLRLGGYKALELFPSGMWMSPDRKYGLIMVVSVNGKQHRDEPPHTIEFQPKAIKLPE